MKMPEITAIIPIAPLWTYDVKQVGGFDEGIAAHEDTDFFLKLHAHRICGIHVPEALFHYSAGGQRSVNSRSSGTEKIVHSMLEERYKDLRMACCGDDNENIKQYPLGTKQPGDVLAQAMWQGNRSEYGRGTGRRYHRMCFPKTTWVHPRDVEMKPDHWRQVIEPAVDDPYRLPTPKQFATAIVGGQEKPVEEPPVPEVVVEQIEFNPEDYTPDISYIVETAKKKLAK